MECSDKENRNIKYYILFNNYEEGLALYDIMKEEGVRAVIAPTPYSIQKELSCGMSLLIEAKDIDNAKVVLGQRKYVYHDIVPLEGQINPNRDKYC